MKVESVLLLRGRTVDRFAEEGALRGKEKGNPTNTKEEEDDEVVSAQYADALRWEGGEPCPRHIHRREEKDNLTPEKPDRGIFRGGKKKKVSKRGSVQLGGQEAQRPTTAKRKKRGEKKLIILKYMMKKGVL